MVFSTVPRSAAVCSRKSRGDKKAETMVRGPDDVKTLTQTERLFGVTGFRARLAIDRLEVKKAEDFEISSVKLDRFTGGPMDNALFKTQAHRDVEVHVSLRLAHATEADVTFTEQLITDICREGEVLVLGHGGSKGFGWFNVAREMRP